MKDRKPLDEGHLLIFLNASWYKNKKAAKYKGKVKLDGKEYVIQMWEKFGGNCKIPYFSGSIAELNQYIKTATQESLYNKRKMVEAVEEENRKLLEARNYFKKED